MKIQVRINASGLYGIDPGKYQNEWENHCDENGDMEEDADYPPISEEFVIESFQEDLENGNIGLDEVLETADIDVKAA